MIDLNQIVKAIRDLPHGYIYDLLNGEFRSFNQHSDVYNEQGIHVRPSHHWVTTNTYPVFDDDGRYTGYMLNGRIGEPQ